MSTIQSLIRTNEDRNVEEFVFSHVERERDWVEFNSIMDTFEYRTVAIREPYPASDISQTLFIQRVIQFLSLCWDKIETLELLITPKTWSMIEMIVSFILEQSLRLKALTIDCIHGEETETADEFWFSRHFIDALSHPQQVSKLELLRFSYIWSQNFDFILRALMTWKHDGLRILDIVKCSGVLFSTCVQLTQEILIKCRIEYIRLDFVHFIPQQQRFLLLSLAERATLQLKRIEVLVGLFHIQEMVNRWLEDTLPNRTKIWRMIIANHKQEGAMEHFSRDHLPLVHRKLVPPLREYMNRIVNIERRTLVSHGRIPADIYEEPLGVAVMDNPYMDITDNQMTGIIGMTNLTRSGNLFSQWLRDVSFNSWDSLYNEEDLQDERRRRTEIEE